MSSLEIRVVDPHDESQLHAWWKVGRDSSAERPVDAWPVWEAARRVAQLERTDGRRVLVSAIEDGVTVGAGRLFLFAHDNNHLADLDLHVTPSHRRRGIGRAVLGELERHAREDGRTTIVASTYPPVAEESPGSRFAAATGYHVASAEESKVVDLTSAPAAWPELDAEVDEALDDYRVEVLDGPIPDEWIEDFCGLLCAFLGEIPSGDLDLRQELWTPQRVREHEERMTALGITQVIAVGVAPDGHLCGFTDLRVEEADPRHASVGATLVLPGHRGHRLGLAMKLGNHRRVRELFPECAYVDTTNAGVNAWMNAVNERMGYRVVERCLDVQKKL